MSKKILISALSVLMLLSIKPIQAQTAVPSINYFVNGVDGMTTIVNATEGDTLNIVWSATNVAYCEKWGVWGAGERLVGLSGTDSVIAPKTLTAVTGFNYQIDCFDIDGVHIAQGGAQVNVAAKPTPTPTINVSLPRVKGQGQITNVGNSQISVNNTVIKYSISTKIKNIFGYFLNFMVAKWEGTQNPDGTINATKIEIL